MKFALTTLYVKDMAASLAFYNTLLELPILSRQSMGPGQELVFLGEEGKPNLELIRSDDAPPPSGFSIGFEVDDLAAVKQRLAAGGYTIKREISPGPMTLCFFDGPNGEEIELIARN